MTQLVVLQSEHINYIIASQLTFPQIDLAYDSNDQIEEFTVEWQYSYFTAEKAKGGSQAPASGRPDVATGTVV